MASHGKRVHQVPPQPRSKVLRAGIRLVGEQFAPYDDGPDVDIIILGAITSSVPHRIVGVDQDGMVFATHDQGLMPELSDQKHFCMGGDLIMSLGGHRFVLTAFTGTFVVAKEFAPKPKPSFADYLAEAMSGYNGRADFLSFQGASYTHSLRDELTNLFNPAEPEKPKPIDPTIETDKIRPDGKPRRVKQEEPAYVKLTKKKRR